MAPCCLWLLGIGGGTRYLERPTHSPVCPDGWSASGGFLLARMADMGSIVHIFGLSNWCISFASLLFHSSSRPRSPPLCPQNSSYTPSSLHPPSHPPPPPI